MNVVLDAQERGTQAALVGGGKEVASFARGARDLMDNGRCGHPELACFDSWDAVVEYVDHDAQGGELKLLVDLVVKYTPETLVAALSGTVSEAKADLVVSTAHKAKGREWPKVLLHSDFATFGKPTADGTPRDPSDGELRLRYVAVTRARHVLDDAAIRAKKPKAVTS